MKKRLRIFSVIMMSLLLCSAGTTVFAAGQNKDTALMVGDTIEFENEEYVVYFIDENGTHITKDGIMPISSSCVNGQSHNYIRQPGTSTKDVKVNNNSSVCYNHYVYVRSKCSRCGDVVTSQDSATSKGHKYSFFGKKCTNVVNGSTCTYEK